MISYNQVCESFVIEHFLAFGIFLSFSFEKLFSNMKNSESKCQQLLKLLSLANVLKKVKIHNSMLCGE